MFCLLEKEIEWDLRFGVDFTTTTQQLFARPGTARHVTRGRLGSFDLEHQCAFPIQAWRAAVASLRPSAFPRSPNEFVCLVASTE